MQASFSEAHSTQLYGHLLVVKCIIIVHVNALFLCSYTYFLSQIKKNIQSFFTAVVPMEYKLVYLLSFNISPLFDIIF